MNSAKTVGGTDKPGEPAKEVRLPPLRGELKIWTGPRAKDGSPTWTIYDPSLHRCVRVGWTDGEMLSHWKLGSPTAIAAAVASHSVLRPSTDDVMELAAFLSGAGLLVVGDARSSAGMAAKVAARRHSPAAWAMHNYLFLRMRLVDPDRFLSALRPLFGWLFSSVGALLLTVLSLSAIGLAWRQRDAFVGGLVDMISPTGALSVALALGFCKIIHEVGHGLAAKRFGLRVPGAGVAFMVLWPVLWTDLTEAWKLPSRRDRLLVDAGGMLAELLVASLAVLLWAVLPDGALRSAALVVGGTAWLATLAVNLNPFMRFDGYYLLSDALDFPNLQERGFAFGRWRMRRTLIGSPADKPEHLPPGMEALITAWAYATWIWRAVVFFGIALLVYHLAFKALGIVLMVIELWFFLFGPAVRELWAWRKEMKGRGMNARIVATGLAAGLIGLAVFVPWSPRVLGAAIERPAMVLAIKVSEPGTVRAAPQEGQIAITGSVLAELASTEVTERLGAARSRLIGLQAAIMGQGFDDERRGSMASSVEEAASAAGEVAVLEARSTALGIKAPFTGIVVDVPMEQWHSNVLPRGENLGTLVSSDRVIEAYVDEADLRRLDVGADAWFYPEDGSQPLPARVQRIGAASARELESRELGSPHGGLIRTRAGKDGMLLPETAIYRVMLDLEERGGAAPAARRRGVVSIKAPPESIASRVFRWAAGIGIREWGL